MSADRQKLQALSILIADEPQALVRVLDVIAKRGLNISSLEVAPVSAETNEEKSCGISRIALVTACDDDAISLMCHLIGKIVTVFSVEIVTENLAWSWQMPAS
ncbi:hypothetical protein K2X96_01775 [Patescibacteria group bacterium]|nr:hypothetical protein [Patescibacteria group bacterium]